MNSDAARSGMDKLKEPTGKVVLVFTGSQTPASCQIDKIKDAYLDSGATMISLDYRGFGKSVKEEDHLGGVVLHSAVSTSHEAATNLHGCTAEEGLDSWIFGGAYDTRSHMRRLYRNDPTMPVHYIGRDEKDDFASLQKTKLDAIPEAKFANASTYHGTEDHLGRNVSAADPGLRAMVQNRRSAQLAPSGQTPRRLWSAPREASSENLPKPQFL